MIDHPDCPCGPEDPSHDPLACDSGCICAVVAFWHHDVCHVTVEPDHVLKTVLEDADLEIKCTDTFYL